LDKVFESYPQDWTLVRLRDIGQIDRGRSRHRPRYAEHLYGGPYPFIQTGDIKASGGRITTYTQTYSETGLAQSRMWPAETMCITIAANIAETGVLQFPACFPDSVVGFIADKSRSDVYFVEYMFRYLRRQIQFQATGSVQDNINLATLDRLYFPLPTLNEQRQIAAILGSLDDKIELNRRENETQEAIARALFKSWFVDFDPVRAKAEGRQPTGMDAETAALFPDSFEDSPLGEIPRGWEVNNLADVIDLIGGGTPKTSISEYWNGDVKWFSVVDIPNPSDVFVVDTEKRITLTGLNNSSAKVLPIGTTIITARGTVGKLALVGEPMAMNQSCYGVQGRFDDGNYFTHFLLREVVQVLQQHTHGSVFDTITRDTFKSIDVVIPPTELIRHFDLILEPFLRRILNNLYQSRTSAQTRDALLPKLLSGEIRVGQAESFISQSLDG
jgi:type I restriction enzyme, S subunit